MELGCVRLALEVDAPFPRFAEAGVRGDPSSVFNTFEVGPVRRGGGVASVKVVCLNEARDFGVVSPLPPPLLPRAGVNLPVTRVWTLLSWEPLPLGDESPASPVGVAGWCDELPVKAACRDFGVGRPRLPGA